MIMVKLLFVALFALASLTTAVPPRQPRDTYLQVPEVPAPSSYALARLIESSTFASLDGDGDGHCTEREFLKRIGVVVHAAAEQAWAYIDTNEDGQLDLEELTATVKKNQKASGKFVASRVRWPFLWILALHFGSVDLSRSARIATSAMQKHVVGLLESVPLLDERRDLYDAIAGHGVGDDGGSFGPNEWDTWQQGQKANKRSKQKKKTGRAQGQAKTEL